MAGELPRRKEIALERRAMLEGWDTPLDARGDIVARMVNEAINSPDPRIAIEAGKALMAMDHRIAVLEQTERHKQDAHDPTADTVAQVFRGILDLARES